MKKITHHVSKKIAWLFILAAAGICQNASAVLFDGGVDSANLGKGDWIYYMSQATNKLGGHITTVVDVPTLMNYEKSQGMSFIIVKAGTGSTNFPSDSNIQFSTALVTAAHTAGLKIFGYTRSYGDNVQGEIDLATSVYNKGADGFVIDAETEWESGYQGTQGPAKAIQYGSGIKSLWPTKFLAHAPMPVISLHSSFPNKEFGLYCEAVMPQDYWYSFGKTPTATVDWMDTEWRNWQNGLTGSDTNSIKPLAPIGQSDTTAIPGSDITEFVNYLNTDPKCVTSTGYRGVSYWRADLQTTSQWSAIAAASIGGPLPNENSIVIDNPAASIVGSWSTGTMAVDKFGSDYRYKSAGGGLGYLQYTPTIASAGNYQIYEWHSIGGNRTADAPYSITYNGGLANLVVNQQIEGGKWNWLGTFNLLNGTAGNVKITDGFTIGTIVIADAIKFLPVPADIIIDNPSASLMGTWSLGTGAVDKYGADYRYKGPGSGSASVQFVPNITTAGNYQVYEWHSAGGNRTTAGKHIINYNGGSQTYYVNQQIYGGTWNLLGTFNFAAGTSGTVTINDSYSAGTVVIADAIKLVFVSQ
ncbi:MAG: hypothetical protein M3Y82_00505 [Verrucomicrobiota bacterium]|nr:hypothetical protein [Verrucomicrobiota bacterium]